MLGQNPWYPQCPLFLTREFVLPRLENTVFFYLTIVGNSGSLMLACSNAHVSGEYNISGVAFSAAF